VKTSPIANSDEDGLLTRTRSGPLFEGNCGAFEVWWVFYLDAPAPCNGYIVQEINITENHGCGGIMRSFTFRFWEAWKVRKGEFAPRAPLHKPNDRRAWQEWGPRKRDVHPADGQSYPVDDKWEARAVDGTDGDRRQTGLAAFFCDYTTGDLSTRWWPPAEGLSGRLPSTRNREWWMQSWLFVIEAETSGATALTKWHCCQNTTFGSTSVIP